MTARTIFAFAAGVGLATLVGWNALAMADTPKPGPDEVVVQFAGGHDTNPVDHGRPVVLVAAALGVPEDVFREAFSHVRPARSGGPSREEAQKNKHELLSRLEKNGVTNDRLDAVSNFYRYRPQEGELWKHKDAVAFATIEGGRVIAVRIIDPGYGYSSQPTMSVQTVPGFTATAVVHFDKDLSKNGSIESIKVASPTTMP